MSSIKNQDDKEQPKKRSLLGLLFNPRVDREIAPLKESMGMFVRMLALIFASYKLFPKDHPALNDMRLRLTMGMVIGTAFSKLSFTKQGIPQIILFFAVVGCLLFSFLIVLTILSTLFVGNAHAQGIFTSPATEDWGIQWIDYLFQGKDFTLSSSTVTPPSGKAMQEALASALSFYSTAVLALAGLLLIYHLVFMIAETAQTGKPMGRANQIWGPIRLVFAIGMLVPIGVSSGSTSTVVGYNTAQYLAMQVGRWGSGLASRVWQNFSTDLNAKAAAGACESAGSPSCIEFKDNLRNVVRGLMSLEACAYITNFYINQAMLNPGSTFDKNSGTFSELATTTGSFSDYIDDMKELSDVDTTTASAPLQAQNFVLVLSQLDQTTKLDEGRHLLPLVTSSFNNFGYFNTAEFCGGYDVPKRPKDGPYVQVFDAQLAQFNGLMTSVHNYVVKHADDMIPHSGSYNAETLSARAKDLSSLMDTFDKNVSSAVKTALENAKVDAQKELTDAAGKNFTTTGWLTAATWFNKITRLMADRYASVNNALPEFIMPFNGNSGPTLTLEGDANKSIDGVVKSAHSSFYKFITSFDQEAIYYSQNNQNKGGICFDLSNVTIDSIKSVMSSLNPMRYFLDAVDCVGMRNNIWDEEGRLSLSFGSTLNPLAELAAWGQNNVAIGTDLMGWGGAIYAIGGTTILGTGITGFAAFLGGILISIASLFYLVGFTFGFVVPLYPFYRFFFGALQWIMSVFELIVLAPLFALAHVNPYGEGLAGQNGKYGYSVAMQVLLRPVLMIFGLIAGFLLFSVTLHFLNDVFILTAKGTGAYGGGNHVIAKILYSVIYCVMVLILANQCFSTIGLFPQVAMSYLGMQSVREESIRDTTMLAAGAAYIGKDVLGSKLPGMVKGPTDAIQGYVKNKQALNEKTQAGKDGILQHLESLGPDRYKDSKYYNPNDQAHQSLFNKNQSQFTGTGGGAAGGNSPPSGGGARSSSGGGASGGSAPSGGRSGGGGSAPSGGGSAGNLAGGTGSAGPSDDDGFTPGAV